MSAFFVSVITVLGVLAAAYLTAIVAEDYRRFRDSKSLAAALAGELRAYHEAYELIVPLMADMRTRTERDEPLYVPLFKPPTDPVYDSGVERLGLLGPKLARDLAYTYQNLKAFRGGYATFTENYAKMGKHQRAQSLEGTNDALLRAKQRGEALIVALNDHATASYKLPLIRITVVGQAD